MTRHDCVASKVRDAVVLEFAQIRLDRALGVWALKVGGGGTRNQPHCTFQNVEVPAEEILETARHQLQTWGYIPAAIAWVNIDGDWLMPVSRMGTNQLHSN